MRMVALDRRASLRDGLVRQFAVNTHSIMASRTTPGIHAAQESCQPATYVRTRRSQATAATVTG